MITEKSALSRADPRLSDASSSGMEEEGGRAEPLSVPAVGRLEVELKLLLPPVEGVRVPELRGGVDRAKTSVAF